MVDQLIVNKSYYKFGENDEGNEVHNKFKNVVIKKRKLLPLTSEDGLENLPICYAKVPADCTKKMNLLKKFLVI